MMNRVIKRMQRSGNSSQQRQQQPSPSPSQPRPRPTLTRGQKSHSDSTMETTATSVSSDSTRQQQQQQQPRNHSAPSRYSSNSISSSSGNHSTNSNSETTTTSQHRRHNHNHHHNSDETTSEDDWTQCGLDSNHTTTTTTTTKRTVVSFVVADDESHQPIAASVTLSDEELCECFYTTAELNSFDRDRALTVLMYQTRNKSIPWDDNEHSLRGLEEYTTAAAATTTTDHNTSSSSSSDGHCDATTTSRRTTRKELIQSVLLEQTRLRDTARGRTEVVQASKVSGLSPEELVCELLRGVSCSLSKCERQRAIQLAQKDEKEVSVYNPKWRDQLMSTTQYYNNITSMVMHQFTPTSRRRYLGMVKNKINDWSNSSNRSISSTGTCGDRSTTSSNGSHRHLKNVPTRKAVARNNSVDDSVTSENNGNAEDSIDEVTDHLNTKAVIRTPTRQPKQPFPVHNNNNEMIASPLSIIRQVVYETSKEFDYDHSTSRHSPSNNSMDGHSQQQQRHSSSNNNTTDIP